MPWCMHACVRWLVDGLSGYYFYFYISHRFNTHLKWAGLRNDGWGFATVTRQMSLTKQIYFVTTWFCKLKYRQCYDFNMTADFGWCEFSITSRWRNFSHPAAASQIRDVDKEVGTNVMHPLDRVHESCSFTHLSDLSVFQDFLKPLSTRRSFIRFLLLLLFFTFHFLSSESSVEWM